jgi:radical SAM protein with 4Fe4S-binding SPASM domain
MTEVAGNVREQSFTEIWQGSPVLQQLRDTRQLQGRCGSCEFNELCGGCRCRAYAAFGDYMQEDPACTYQPTGQPLPATELQWSAGARERLDRIPIGFIREKVRKGLETYAQGKGVSTITTDLMKEGLSGEGRGPVFGKLPSFRGPGGEE